MNVSIYIHLCICTYAFSQKRKEKMRKREKRKEKKKIILRNLDVSNVEINAEVRYQRGLTSCDVILELIESYFREKYGIKYFSATPSSTLFFRLSRVSLLIPLQSRKISRESPQE